MGLKVSIYPVARATMGASVWLNLRFIERLRSFTLFGCCCNYVVFQRFPDWVNML